MNASVIHILDLCDSIGEDPVIGMLSDFSCLKNPDIQGFLRQNAIDFAKKKLSVTYLVFSDDAALLGYFTLTHKPLRMDGAFLESASQRKRLARHARYDEAHGTFDASAFLIAQFGRNDGMKEKYDFTGDALMDCALSTLRDIQHRIGGGIVFLECEDKPKLLDFYQSDSNRYKRFGERHSSSDGKTYIQLLRFL